MTVVADVLMAPKGDLVGSTLPRVFTPPAVAPGPSDCPCGVCGLTPENSLGFAVIAFAEFIGFRLIPYQAFLLIHGLELRPDGLPRFRRVLVVLSRQAGKTTLGSLLAAFWLFVEMVPLVWGTSAQRSTAKAAWKKTVVIAKNHPELSPLLASVREANGDETLELVGGSEYRISAANDDAGRGWTIHRLLMDELRQQKNWATYSAAYSAMRAVEDGQCWAITNAGTAASVVLNTFRAQALAQIEQGDAEDVIGLFEWSAVGMGPDGSDDVDLNDRAAWVASMPALGYTITERTVAADAKGDPAPVFRTESLCLPVQTMDAWQAKLTGRFNAAMDGGSVPVGKVTIGIDIDRDRSFASIGVCGTRDDGLAHVEDIESREGIDWLLARTIEVAKGQGAPVVLDAYGPAGSLKEPLILAGVKVIGLGGNDICAGCVALDDAVMESPQTLRVRARVTDDGTSPLGDAVRDVERLWRGDVYRWQRKDAGSPVSPLYAVTLAYTHHRRIKPRSTRPTVAWL